MRRIIFLITVLAMLSLTVNLASCSTDGPIPEIEQPVSPENPDGEGDNNENNNPMSNNLKITIGSVSFNATLVDNAAVTALKELLPMTINMSELNSNEKYYGLPQSLPTSASNPGIIQNGDLMLYGSSTLVLFYKTFSTSYSYTRIGSVDNPSGLQNALGGGSVTVTFELI